MGIGTRIRTKRKKEEECKEGAGDDEKAKEHGMKANERKTGPLRVVINLHTDPSDTGPCAYSYVSAEETRV